MDSGDRKISISFIPLLQKICSFLGLQDPLYNCIGAMNDAAFVLVPKKTEPEAWFFKGEETGSLEESFEYAAKQMVLFLVQEFAVKVADVNFDAWVSADQCANLFMVMRKQFERLEKDLPSSSSNEIVVHDVMQSIAHHVQIDFLPLLKAVVRKFSIPVTPLEVTSLCEGQYKAWFTFEVPNYMPPTISVIGEESASASEAKEVAAKKGISLMMPFYKFQVEDVNYHFLPLCHYACKFERESYLTIRERVFGFKDDQLPQPYIVEQDLLTPCGEKNSIVKSNVPPAAPKKRKPGKRARSFADVVPNFLVPEELETVLKRKKKE